MSNKLSQSQTRTELRHMANFEVGHLIDHPEIWLLMWKETLNAEEQSRLHSFLIGALRFREFIWRQYQMGLLDKQTFDNYILVVVQQLSSPRTRLWWDRYKTSGTFDQAFVNLVQELLENSPDFELQQHMESM